MFIWSNEFDPTGGRLIRLKELLMRVISLCADGIKNAAEKGFYSWIKEQDADFICIQDLGCAEYDLQADQFLAPEYNA